MPGVLDVLQRLFGADLRVKKRSALQESGQTTPSSLTVYREVSQSPTTASYCRPQSAWRKLLHCQSPCKIYKALILPFLSEPRGFTDGSLGILFSSPFQTSSSPSFACVTLKFSSLSTTSCYLHVILCFCLTGARLGFRLLLYHPVTLQSLPLYQLLNPLPTATKPHHHLIFSYQQKAISLVFIFMRKAQFFSTIVSGIDILFLDLFIHKYSFYCLTNVQLLQRTINKISFPFISA